jgi:hypothetical protein
MQQPDGTMHEKNAEIPPALRSLLHGEKVPKGKFSATALRLLLPLCESKVIAESYSGRGSVLEVVRQDLYRQWLERRFPVLGGWSPTESGATRAEAIAARRSSKAGRAGVGQSILHLRTNPQLEQAIKVTVDGRNLPVADLCQAHGLASTLINDGSKLSFEGSTVLIVENLECFLRFEQIHPAANLAIFGNGRLSERIIDRLAFSERTTEFVHLPDYDPVGLAEYQRLRRRLGARLRLYVPENLDQLFAELADTELIRTRPRNQETLSFLVDAELPCEASRRVLAAIRRYGAGLEQESLLLKRERPQS